MNPPLAHRSRVGIIVLTTAVFVIVAAAVVFLQTTNKTSEFDSVLNESLQAINTYDYENAEIAAAKAKILAATPEEAESANFVYARSLIGQKNSEKMSEAVSIFTHIATDDNAEPQRRAGAYVSLGRIFFEDPERMLIRELVFNQPSLNKYLSSANNDIYQATVAVMEQANSIFPTQAAFYDIATILRMKIHSEGIKPGNPEQIQLAQKIKASLENGDTLAAQTGAVSDSLLVHEALMKSLALGTAHYLIPNEVTNADVNTSYEKSLTLMKDHSQDPSRYITTCLTYAASLTARQPKEMSGRIDELLGEIVQRSNDNPDAKNIISSATNSSFTAQQLPLLMQRNADFARLVADSRNQPVLNITSQAE